jgi:hypothetical protein
MGTGDLAGPHQRHAKPAVDVRRRTISRNISLP